MTDRGRLYDRQSEGKIEQLQASERELTIQRTGAGSSHTFVAPGGSAEE